MIDRKSKENSSNKPEVNTEVLLEVGKRPGKRKFGTEGPLSFFQTLSLPGYRLFLAPDKHGKDPFYLQKLLHPTVGYEFVKAEEVGVTELDGKTVEKDAKVSVPGDSGATLYLLKQPLQWALEDQKSKEDFCTQGIYKNDNESVDIKGFIGTKTTFSSRPGRLS